MIRALLAAHLLASLVALTMRGAEVINPLVETLVLLLSVGACVAGLIQSRSRSDRPSRALALLPMLSVVALWRMSRHTIGLPLLNAFILAAGALLLVASWKAFPCGGTRSVLSAVRPRWRIAAAVLAVSAALVASAVARSAFSTPVLAGHLQVESHRAPPLQ